MIVFNFCIHFVIRNFYSIRVSQILSKQLYNIFSYASDINLFTTMSSVKYNKYLKYFSSLPKFVSCFFSFDSFTVFFLGFLERRAVLEQDSEITRELQISSILSSSSSSTASSSITNTFKSLF